MGKEAKPPRSARLSIDVSPEARREIRLAAASRDQTIRDYVRDAIAARLRRDRVRMRPLAALHQAEDPVLGELWDNPRDAVYDKF